MKAKQRTAFYYYVDCEQHDAPRPDAARFHAQYRQAYPCPKGTNYGHCEIWFNGAKVGELGRKLPVSG